MYKVIALLQSYSIVTHHLCITLLSLDDNGLKGLLWLALLPFTGFIYLNTKIYAEFTISFTNHTHKIVYLCVQVSYLCIQCIQVLTKVTRASKLPSIEDCLCHSTPNKRGSLKTSVQQDMKIRPKKNLMVGGKTQSIIGLTRRMMKRLGQYS